MVFCSVPLQSFQRSSFFLQRSIKSNFWYRGLSVSVCFLSVFFLFSFCFLSLLFFPFSHVFRFWFYLKEFLSTFLYYLYLSLSLEVSVSHSLPLLLYSAYGSFMFLYLPGWHRIVSFTHSRQIKPDQFRSNRELILTLLA